MRGIGTETISSASGECAVNQIVSKRMVKKQQMRWAPKSAHLLLQVRAKVLNNELGSGFKLWYPTFATPAESNNGANRAGRVTSLGFARSPTARGSFRSDRQGNLVRTAPVGDDLRFTHASPLCWPGDRNATTEFSA